MALCILKNCETIIVLIIKIIYLFLFHLFHLLVLHFKRRSSKKIITWKNHKVIFKIHFRGSFIITHTYHYFYIFQLPVSTLNFLCLRKTFFKMIKCFSRTQYQTENDWLLVYIIIIIMRCWIMKVKQFMFWIHHKRK